MKVGERGDHRPVTRREQFLRRGCTPGGTHALTRLVDRCSHHPLGGSASAAGIHPGARERALVRGVRGHPEGWPTHRGPRRRAERRPAYRHVGPGQAGGRPGRGHQDPLQHARHPGRADDPDLRRPWVGGGGRRCPRGRGVQPPPRLPGAGLRSRRVGHRCRRHGAGRAGGARDRKLGERLPHRARRGPRQANSARFALSL